MTTALSAFLPYITPYAAGVSDPVAYHALRQALDKFCRETHITQDRQVCQLLVGTDVIVGDFEADHYNGITVNGNLRYPFAINGTYQYVVTAPAGMRPYEPQTIWFSGQGGTNKRNVAPAPVRALDNDPTFLDPDKEGTPRYYTRMPEEYITIVPIEVANPPPIFEARIAYTILDDTIEVADLLFENWRNTVAALALSMLHGMPDQAWSDNALKIQRLREYREGRSQARNQIEFGRVRSTVVPQNRRWA